MTRQGLRCSLRLDLEFSHSSPTWILGLALIRVGTKGSPVGTIQQWFAIRVHISYCESTRNGIVPPGEGSRGTHNWYDK